MTTIFAQVRGDAIRGRVLANSGRRDGVRVGSAPCLPQCGHVIDVDGLLAFEWLASFAFVKSYAGTLVAALAVVAACSSNKPTTTNPPLSDNAPIVNAPTAPTAELGLTGATDARSAAQAFLNAGKAQDLQALSAVWGSKDGPLRNMVSHAELEKRELVMMCFLKHDTDSIGSPSAAAGSRVVFPVTLVSGRVSRVTSLTTMVGPASRWYVEKIDLRAIEALCQKGPN
jgi:hypothetical protein